MVESRSGVSGVIIGLLLILLIGSFVIIFYIFAIGPLQGGGFSGSSAGVQLSIVPQIYGQDAGVAVLGQLANFTVVVTNTGSTDQLIAVLVEAPRGRIFQSVSTGVAASYTKTIVVRQPLNETGSWTVAVTALSLRLGGYAFTVAEDRAQADYAIAQYRQTQLYRVLTYLLLAVSISAIILAAIAIVRVGRLATELRSLSKPHETI
jgi:hypothetical protein